jgi:hypothetical protein
MNDLVLRTQKNARPRETQTELLVKVSSAASMLDIYNMASLMSITEAFSNTFL